MSKLYLLNTINNRLPKKIIIFKLSSESDKNIFSGFLFQSKDHFQKNFHENHIQKTSFFSEKNRLQK